MKAIEYKWLHFEDFLVLDNAAVLSTALGTSNINLECIKLVSKSTKISVFSISAFGSRLEWRSVPRHKSRQSLCVGSGCLHTR